MHFVFYYFNANYDKNKITNNYNLINEKVQSIYPGLGHTSAHNMYDNPHSIARHTEEIVNLFLEISVCLLSLPYILTYTVCDYGRQTPSHLYQPLFIIYETPPGHFHTIIIWVIITNLFPQDSPKLRRII